MARNSQSGKFEISGGGVLLLGVATLLASAIIFLLGIYVGKGMVEGRMTAAAKVVRLPVPSGDAPAKPGEKSGEVDVTFWDKLAKGESGTPAPAVPSPTAVETPVRVAPQAAAAPTSKAVEPTAAPAKAAATRAPTKEPPAAPASGSGGGYEVQVNAMSDRARADQLVLDLKGLGYSAYISPARVSEKTLYRVRVSGLDSEQAARQAVSKLREQGYPNAFLVAGGR